MTQVLFSAAMAGVALWILGPLRRPLRTVTFADDARWQELVELKHALYRGILDLEFDQAVGKVSEADYVFLRRQQEGEALAVLAEMDAIASGETGAPKGGPAASMDTLEAEIAAARQRLRPHS